MILNMVLNRVVLMLMFRLSLVLLLLFAMFLPLSFLRTLVSFVHLFLALPIFLLVSGCCLFFLCFFFRLVLCAVSSFGLFHTFHPLPRAL